MRSFHGFRITDCAVSDVHAETGFEVATLEHAFEEHVDKFPKRRNTQWKTLGYFYCLFLYIHA